MIAPWLQTMMGSVAGQNAAPTLVSARYWAVKCDQSRNASYIGFANLEMRLAIGGADQTTLGQTVFGAENGTKVATNAYDADTTTTFWNVNKTSIADAWNGQDFGVPVTIREIEIGARVDANNYDQTPHYFQVWHSDDGITWTTILTVSNEVAWASGEKRAYVVQ